MALSAKRWKYLKSMRGHSAIPVSKPQYKWPKGKRKIDTYRGKRCNEYRKEKFSSARALRKERWKNMQMFGVAGL